MAQLLELPHLVEQHGMAEVQVRRGRIEARLDAQRAAELQAGLQLVALEDLVGAATDEVEGLLCVRVTLGGQGGDSLKGGRPRICDRERE